MQRISELAYIEDMDVVVYSIEGTATIFASKIDKTIS
jgi:hypothetical protein